jgi:hypothetical protein
MTSAQERPNMPLTAMGWGAMSEGGLSPSLLTAVSLPLVPSNICQSYMSPYRWSQGGLYFGLNIILPPPPSTKWPCLPWFFPVRILYITFIIPLSSLISPLYQIYPQVVSGEPTSIFRRSIYLIGFIATIFTNSKFLRPKTAILLLLESTYESES